MEITLNDKQHTIPGVSTLSQLIFAQVADKQNGIAVAVNDEVIAKSNWGNYLVKEHDKILIIKATQGG